jgi:Asp-tRNA(Asn)/Glu-tRNA(Gln) amidotransferase C subunit
VAGSSEITAEDVRRITSLLGQDLSDEEIARIHPQVKGVLMAAKRVYDLDLGDLEPSGVFELPEDQS